MRRVPIFSQGVMSFLLTKALPGLTVILAVARTVLSQVPSPSVQDISFRAIHNAYQRPDPPSVQITNYNIWEVEIDFGWHGCAFWPPTCQSGLFVGHEGPGAGTPNHGFNYKLVDWLTNVASAGQNAEHPIFIKFEANSSCHSFWCFTYWSWPDIWDWAPDWQSQFLNAMDASLGLGNILRPSDLNGNWPSVAQLAGKYVIMLQTRHVDDLAYINDPTLLSYVFIGGFPGLNHCSPESTDDPIDFAQVMIAPPNRVTFEECSFDCDDTWNGAQYYTVPWTNRGLQPPVPIHVVGGSNVTQATGTSVSPFRLVGHAASAARVIPILPSQAHEGRPSHAITELAAGNYAERLSITKPMTLRSSGGIATIGGPQIAYTVAVELAAVTDSASDGPVTVTLTGNLGTLSRSFGNTLGYDGIVVPAFISSADDIGDLLAVTVEVGTDDDLLIHSIYVDSGLRGRYYVPVNTWVGHDHQPNGTQSFGVTAHWD